MEAILGRQRLILPIAPIAASVAAALAAFAVMAMPIDVLEGMTTDSGIAALVTAAAPPLGMTARLAIAFLAALLIGGLLWFGLGLLLGNRSIVLRRGAGEDGVPVLRRADAHPDAPPRQPVFANRDLGTPFLDVRAEPRVTGERPLPRDLDTPLSAYLHPLDRPLPPPPEPQPAPIEAETPVPLSLDAAPLPIWLSEADVPRETAAQAIVPPPSDPDAGPRFAAHERIEAFELTPLVPAEPTASPVPVQPSATIHDLLARLERGVARRSPAPAAVAEPLPAPSSPVSDQSIEETLAVLRQLATRVG